MNKCLLITNPLSGKYSRKKAEFIVNELGRCGITVLKHELGVDEKVSDVIKNIDAKDINHIILAFGDGTINNPYSLDIVYPLNYGLEEELS